MEFVKIVGFYFDHHFVIFNWHSTSYDLWFTIFIWHATYDVLCDFLNSTMIWAMGGITQKEHQRDQRFCQIGAPDKTNPRAKMKHQKVYRWNSDLHPAVGENPGTSSFTTIASIGSGGLRRQMVSPVVCGRPPHICCQSPTPRLGQPTQPRSQPPPTQRPSVTQPRGTCQFPTFIPLAHSLDFQHLWTFANLGTGQYKHGQQSNQTGLTRKRCVGKKTY